MNLKYDNDKIERNSRCANCDKVLDITLGRTNKYFCNNYCKVKFTFKAQERRITAKQKLKMMGWL